MKHKMRFWKDNKIKIRNKKNRKNKRNSRLSITTKIKKTYGVFFQIINKLQKVVKIHKEAVNNHSAIYRNHSQAQWTIYIQPIVLRLVNSTFLSCFKPIANNIIHKPNFQRHFRFN
jgi:hypothetical protein